MLRSIETAGTPWRQGPFRVGWSGITFGRTYEDSAIELRAFRPGSRVFSIAGAGDTARALAAAGHRVTAVDIDARQLAYAQSRAAGAPARMGAVEHLLAFGRRFAAAGGWSRGRLTEFLNLSDCARQIEYWDRWLESRLWRCALDALLSPSLLRFCYAGPMAASLPRDFGGKIRERLRRCFASHPNRSNPYAASLLAGAPTPEPGSPATAIEFACADAAEFLEGSIPSSFDAFDLSNIGDGAPPAYLHRLQRAIQHAAAPDAIVVSRSFAEPKSDTGENWAAQDRSMLWGVVDVRPAAMLGKGGEPCSIC